MKGFVAFVMMVAVLACASIASAGHGLNRFQQRQVNQAQRAVHRNVQRNFNNHHHVHNVQFVPVQAVYAVPVQAVPVQAAPAYAPSCGQAQFAPSFAPAGCGAYFR